MSELDTFADSFVEADPYPVTHPVRRFFGRLLLVLVLAVGAGAVYVWHYQPLASGGAYGVQGDKVRETESAGGSNVVTYGAGDSFETIFSVRNTGRVTVHIMGVPNSDLAPLSAAYDVTMMPARATAYDKGAAQPFGPFSLRPGEERVLNLSYTFRDCGPPATAGNRAVTRQRVRYELGRPWERVADVRLGQPLVILRMPAC
ncbi:MAG: hypothetical protein WCB04_01220 [Mycobacteriales bacterium]